MRGPLIALGLLIGAAVFLSLIPWLTHRLSPNTPRVRDVKILDVPAGRGQTQFVMNPRGDEIVVAVGACDSVDFAAVALGTLDMTLTSPSGRVVTPSTTESAMGMFPVFAPRPRSRARRLDRGRPKLQSAEGQPGILGCVLSRFL